MQSRNPLYFTVRPNCFLPWANPWICKRFFSRSKGYIAILAKSPAAEPHTKLWIADRMKKKMKKDQLDINDNNMTYYKEKDTIYLKLSLFLLTFKGFDDYGDTSLGEFTFLFNYKNITQGGSVP